MKLQLNIKGSQGYAPDQVKTMTVGELKELLEGYGEGEEIYLYDTCNAYGAKFGTILNIEEDYDDEEDEIEESLDENSNQYQAYFS
jgi:hypothetical protein